jgi:hypothetical protein
MHRGTQPPQRGPEDQEPRPTAERSRRACGWEPDHVQDTLPYLVETISPERRLRSANSPEPGSGRVQDQRSHTPKRNSACTTSVVVAAAWNSRASVLPAAGSSKAPTASAMPCGGHHHSHAKWQAIHEVASNESAGWFLRQAVGPLESEAADPTWRT